MENKILKSGVKGMLKDINYWEEELKIANKRYDNLLNKVCELQIDLDDTEMRSRKALKEIKNIATIVKELKHYD